MCCFAADATFSLSDFVRMILRIDCHKYFLVASIIIKSLPSQVHIV